MEDSIIKYILDNQKDLRARLEKIMLENPDTIAHMAKEIGVHHLTFKGFLEQKKRLDLKRMIKIYNYVTKMENK